MAIETGSYLDEYNHDLATMTGAVIAYCDMSESDQSAARQHLGNVKNLFLDVGHTRTEISELECAAFQSFGNFERELVNMGVVDGQ